MDRVKVTSSPHIHENITTRKVMKEVLIALLPALIAGLYFFKFDALLVILISVASCIASEYLWQRFRGERITTWDLSAAVTGLLLAFCLPPKAPLWIPFFGGVFAIIIVKQLFGGLGYNFLNPALAARAFLLASWPDIMSRWTIDGVTSATPLAMLRSGGNMASLFDVFIGNVAGCIGETSAIALLIGGLYLIYRRIISIRIPASFIGTVLILSTVFGRGGFMTINPFYELFAGGLILGAFFMATDYTTSPMTPKGQVIMGVGCGVITYLIRLYGQSPEGVCYSILIMNLFVPMIERHTVPRIYGEGR